MKTFTFEIILPNEILVLENVAFAVFPCSEGELGVLPGHEPLLARLKAGFIRYFTSDSEVRLNAAAGVVDIDGKSVRLYTTRIKTEGDGG